MSTDVVIWEKDAEDAFVTLTLNRPDKMNSMNQELGDALEAAIVRAAKDPEIRAVVITGAGRAFTAGFDLGGEDFEMDGEAWREDIGANMRRMKLIREAPIPIIAAVNGYCLAGGLELMMCCDMTIAAEDAMLGEPEVRHVSAPPTLMLPWTVPMIHARHLMYTGDLIDGREAALNHQQQTAGLDSSWTYNRETTAILHASEEGRYWMRLLKDHSLKEFLDIREKPFRDLD